MIFESNGYFYKKVLIHKIKNLIEGTAAEQFISLIGSMRPKQWTKNLIVFLPIAFTINLAWDPKDIEDVSCVLIKGGSAFGLFCLLSSAVYLINDSIDKKRDQLHPKKWDRPIASGKLHISLALFAAAILVAISITGGFILSIGFGVSQCAYMGTMLLYIVIMRNLAILDVFAISAGFVIRAAAGALVISASPSPWLYVCTGLGALFIGFAKRRQELITLGDKSVSHRNSLGQYSENMLDHLITMLMSATLIAYILYTFTAENLPSNNAMMFTIPFVTFAIARYFHLIHAKQAGGNPEDILIKDIPTLLSVLLWITATIGILWAFRN